MGALVWASEYRKAPECNRGETSETNNQVEKVKPWFHFSKYMSAKLTSDSVKQGFSVPAALLENARKRASELHGGNLSRYLQSLIERDLTEREAKPTDDLPQGGGILAQLAERWRPDVAEEVTEAAAKCRKQERLLGLMLAAIPHFVKAWEKDHRDFYCPPDDFNGLYLIPDYSANELRRFMDRDTRSYDRLMELVAPRMTAEEIQDEEQNRSMQLAITGDDARAAYYLPRMRSTYPAETEPAFEAHEVEKLKRYKSELRKAQKEERDKKVGKKPATRSK